MILIVLKKCWPLHIFEVIMVNGITNAILHQLITLYFNPAPHSPPKDFERSSSSDLKVLLNAAI